MSLITDVASPFADSYTTVLEADTYLASRSGFDITGWTALSETEKEFRLRYGALVVDSLMFRGVPATKDQSLAFPRLFPGDRLYLEDEGQPMQFQNWASLVEYAGLLDTTEPEVPAAVKKAHIEATFQIIHSHVLTIEPFEAGDQQITNLGIDVIKMGFGKATRSNFTLFAKDEFGAISIVKLLLQKYRNRPKDSIFTNSLKAVSCIKPWEGICSLRQRNGVVMLRNGKEADCRKKNSVRQEASVTAYSQRGAAS